MATMLLRPFNYLAVKHDSRVLAGFNWWLPLVMAGGLLAMCLTWPSVNLFHADGLMAKVLGFVQSLPGFYLAALAAVATFQKPDLDTYMPGIPPTARVTQNGAEVTVKLSRRRFLCMMFSYLTALSILLTLAAIGATTFNEPVRALLPPGLVPSLRLLVVSAFAFFFAQMLVITFWGLYYLGERMHTPDA